jgi:ATP-dependent DNA ligase
MARLQGRRARPPGSRNGGDHTRRFRDIAAAISKLSARSLVLDGEVAIYDQQPPLAVRLAEGAGPWRRRLTALFMVFDHRRDDAGGGDQLLLLPLTPRRAPRSP